jgi:beta-xylosidase
VEEPCRRALSRSAASTGYALLDANFPDPSIVAAGGEYFAYATNAVGGSVQMARGPSLDRMRLVGPALDRLPPWGEPSRTWAPTVLHRDGYWVMYYSLQHRQSRGTCISIAVAFSPAGPFVDNSTSPFLCQSGGSIDPSPFVDADGSAWLVWKAERFVAGGNQSIFSQRLADDGLSLVGPATQLMTSDQGWEAGVVEGPSLLRSGDRYVLLYSGGNWNSAGYAVGYAVCAAPAGPCTKPSGAPVYRGGDGLTGAGGEEPFIDLHGRLRMVFHAWAGAEVGYPNFRRPYLADLDVSGPAPRITRVRIGG